MTKYFRVLEGRILGKRGRRRPRMTLLKQASRYITLDFMTFIRQASRYITL